MDAVVQALKDSLVPGSLWLLLLGLSAGVLLLHFRRTLGWGRRWLTCLGITYWILALPAITQTLEVWLANGFRPLSERPPDVRTIIVLGGGNFSARTPHGELSMLTSQSAFSVIEAARVYHLLGDAQVIASGGAPNERLQLRPESASMRDALMRLGVPGDHIIEESASINTQAQAVTLSRLLRGRGERRFILVTSPVHMRRAVALFAAQNVEPVPSVSYLRSDGLAPGNISWMPAEDALNASEWAVYHYLALCYSWTRGWLGPLIH